MYNNNEVISFYERIIIIKIDNDKKYKCNIFWIKKQNRWIKVKILQILYFKF